MVNKFLNILVLNISVILITGAVFAQSTEIQLPTDDATSSFDILRNDNNPVLRSFGDGSFYISGSLDNGLIPVTGAGTRFMWFPGKASLRAGEVSSFGSTYWDLGNFGYWSVAMGNNTRALGNYSFAGGLATSSSGNYSVTLGNNSTAAGEYSFAFNGTANARNTIAMGSGAQATGDSSISLGPSSISSGKYAITLGPSISVGNYSITIGLQNKSSLAYSISIGKNARCKDMGSCVLGDGSAGFNSDSVYSTAPNQMAMRFAGGLNLYTSSDLLNGVSLTAGGSGWASISDSTKKENFIYADGEYFLNSLSKLRLGSWNYKVQDDNIRHYGPMAQEIYHYFGKDALGTIGNDTTLASADMDGIMLICAQALLNRINELEENQSAFIKTSEKISEIDSYFSLQNSDISSQESDIESLKNKMLEVKKRIYALENEDTQATVNPSINTEVNINFVISK